jgi:5-hydroxyisourate hydrolase-like protein (transthyretin family)
MLPTSLALAGEPHLAVVLLVLQHVNQIVEQLTTVTTDQDIRIAYNITRRNQSKSIYKFVSTFFRLRFQNSCEI